MSEYTSDIPTGKVLIVHKVINAYLMPDGISDAETTGDDELQTFFADPWPANASVYWKFEPASGRPGAYHIRSQPNERYLGIRGDVAKANAVVILRLNESNAALWEPTPIPGLPDATGHPLVRALRLRGTNFAMATAGNLPNRDAEIHLDRAWDGEFNLYHAFLLIPESSVTTTP
ncbi:RICIN domain-containing protein [Actinomadura chibensis]|uniref:RICIN domain-containing protein n=1 Tax=Actinomadura chibensis TaxID=392828 RepID=A0A5D0NM99_9ACTN|nr:RICIN domain-containing protein [Actinomadura chibensis]TYB45535.1 RICIN domain-containing protein [Actinomadura chibensis]